MILRLLIGLCFISVTIAFDGEAMFSSGLNDRSIEIMDNIIEPTERKRDNDRKGDTGLFQRALTEDLNRLDEELLQLLESSGWQTCGSYQGNFNQDPTFRIFRVLRTDSGHQCEHSPIRSRSDRRSSSHSVTKEYLSSDSSEVLRALQVLEHHVKRNIEGYIVKSAIVERETASGHQASYLVSARQVSHDQLEVIAFFPPPRQGTRNLYSIEADFDDATHRFEITNHMDAFSVRSHTWTSHSRKRDASPSPSTDLKLMSYNIWNWNENWETVRLPLIVNSIISEMPDVIGFQEVREKWDDPASNQLVQLRNRIGRNYQMIYSASTRFVDKPEEEGQGILVRSDIDIFDILKYPFINPDCDDKNSRIMVLLKLKVPVGGEKIDFNFINTHWSYKSECQPKTAHDMYTMTSSLMKNRTTIVGDLNIYLNGDSVLEALTGNSVENSFVDVWPFLHPTDPGFSFRVGAPQNRADRILIRGPIVPKTMKLIGDKVGDVLPSDHYGLVVVLDLNYTVDSSSNGRDVTSLTTSDSRSDNSDNPGDTMTTDGKHVSSAIVTTYDGFATMPVEQGISAGTVTIVTLLTLFFVFAIGSLVYYWRNKRATQNYGQIGLNPIRINIE